MSESLEMEVIIWCDISVNWWMYVLNLILIFLFLGCVRVIFCNILFVSIVIWKVVGKISLVDIFVWLRF